VTNSLAYEYCGQKLLESNSAPSRAISRQIETACDKLRRPATLAPDEGTKRIGMKEPSTTSTLPDVILPVRIADRP